MTKIHVGKTEVDLNDEHLKFNEANIGEFLQNSAAHYNYYNEQYNNAQYILTCLEDRHEELFSQKFIEYKGSSSDKLAEAKSKCDPEVVDALDKVRKARVVRDLIHSYLRSFDKAHSNGIQLAMLIRKEMEKLFGGIRQSYSSDWQDTVKAADAIVGNK